MAHKIVYICDSCHSFAEANEMYKIKLGDWQTVDSKKFHTVALSHGSNIAREICSTCADRLVEDLNLTTTESDLTNKLFAKHDFSTDQGTQVIDGESTD